MKEKNNNIVEEIHSGNIHDEINLIGKLREDEIYED